MSYIDLNLRQRRSLVTVGRLRSLTQALGLQPLPQPALTKQVRRLEEGHIE